MKMDKDLQFRLQAFVDGELSEDEALEVAALAAREPEANALARELKNTRKALAGLETGRLLPESREFYWSKIQREIERLIPDETPAPRRSFTAALMRWLVPVTALVALLATGYLFFGAPTPHSGGLRWQSDYDGVNALTYRDQKEGMTVIWLTYPGTTEAGSAGASSVVN